MQQPYRNKMDKTGECSATGLNAEDLFYKILSKKGDIRRATRNEQIKHIDLILTADGKTTSFDVKAMKKASRSHVEVSSELVWLEFKNIAGNLGWMLAESLDFLAFEREKDFVVVDRKLLLELSLKICDLTKIVKSSSQALYSSYTRWGRADQISQIKMSDILSIQHEVWEKII